jgi:hypothetical protein
MITKAFIVEKVNNSNKFIVRISVFEKPGIDTTDDRTNHVLFSAILSHEPSTNNQYKVGDCVFVGFENNDLGRPVILGKLYKNNDKEVRGSLDAHALFIQDRAVLPKNTTIGGINWQQVQQLFAEVDYINAKIDGKKTDVEIEYDGEIGGTLVSNVRVDIDNKSKLIVTKTTPSEVLTSEEREKIDVIDLDGDGTKYLADDGEYKFLDLDSKVDKIPGKGLSTNDYTTVEKNKLAGIESNAQVNIIEEIKVNNITQTPVGKSVNITTPDIAVQTTGTGVVSNIVVDSVDKHKLNVTKQQLSVSDLSDGSTVATKTYVDDAIFNLPSFEIDVINGNAESGKAVVSLTADGTELTVVKETFLNSLNVTGSGNALTNITVSGNTITATKGSVGTVTSVSGTGSVSGLTLSGTVTDSGSLSLGGSLSLTGSEFGSKTAKYFLAAPNGSNGIPTFRAIVASDIPILNQNTTGSAGSLATARTLTIGGTGKSFDGSANVSWSLAELGVITSWGASPTNSTFPSSKLVKDTIDALVMGTVTTIDGGTI